MHAHKISMLSYGRIDVRERKYVLQEEDVQQRGDEPVQLPRGRAGPDVHNVVDAGYQGQKQPEHESRRQVRLHHV